MLRLRRRSAAGRLVAPPPAPPAGTLSRPVQVSGRARAAGHLKGVPTVSRAAFRPTRCAVPRRAAPQLSRVRQAFPRRRHADSRVIPRHRAPPSAAGRRTIPTARAVRGAVRGAGRADAPIAPALRCTRAARGQLPSKERGPTAGDATLTTPTADSHAHCQSPAREPETCCKSRCGLRARLFSPISRLCRRSD